MLRWLKYLSRHSDMIFVKPVIVSRTEQALLRLRFASQAIKAIRSMTIQAPALELPEAQIRHSRSRLSSRVTADPVSAN